MSFARIFGISAAFLFLFSAVACTNHTEVNKAWQLINDGALLVDVRTQQEYDAGHLPGAKLIPVKEVEARIAEFGADKSRPVVLYCKSGGRAGRAADMLKSHGFTNVYNAGGYSDLMASKP